MSGDNYLSDDRAKRATGFIAGLEIFAKYWTNGINKSYFMGAEHDVLYIYDSANILEDSEDGKALYALGFYYDEDLGGWAYFT